MRIATGIDTFAYSNLLKVSGITGINRPMATPTIIHAATHSVRYFSKKPNPFYSCIASLLLMFYAPSPFELSCFYYMIIFCYNHIVTNLNFYRKITKIIFSIFIILSIVFALLSKILKNLTFIFPQLLTCKVTIFIFFKSFYISLQLCIFSQLIFNKFIQ